MSLRSAGLLGAYATLAAIVIASLVAGQATLSLCGRRELTWLAGPVGLALLMAVAGIAIRLPGHATAVAIALCAVVIAGGAVLAHDPPAGLRAALPLALGLAVVTTVAASVPFIVNGRVGILGVGLVNDDMASHLLLADWLDSRFDPTPQLINQGYPVGPHSLVAGVTSALGTDLVSGFAGLTLAIPVLVALVASEALGELRALVRIPVAALVALPYLGAAYLAQEAFKEPIEALLVLGFALLLPTLRGVRSAIPLGVLAAGSVYAYSFPGLFWLAGTALVWAAVELVRRRPRPAHPVRLAGPVMVAALAVLLVLTAPDWGRIADFTHFRAFDPGRANEGGLGNLLGYLSPLEGLGIWPTSEFRLSAGEGSLPALVFYGGALIGLAALVLGLPRWIRRHGTAVPAALAAALLAYVGARAFGTVYTSAKALAIAAPLVMLLALGGLVGASRARNALAAVLMLGAALSSFLVLRQAPVAPTDHMDELAQIRPLVQGQKVLFLGRDNFVLYELRGSKPFTHVQNFYDPYFVKPNFDLKDVGSKFDFDSVKATKLARFPYVITTRAAYASGPPPSYRPVLQTDSYVLWRAHDPDTRRAPIERGAEPGGEITGCARGLRAPTAVFARRPVGPQLSWTPSSTIESGSTASATLDLPRGRWQLSLQYDATRPVTLSAPGLHATVPGNLDYRGTAPYWPAGEIQVPHSGPVRVEVAVQDPPLAGRLLGGHAVAHLGSLAATPAGPGYVRRTIAPAPGDGERILPLGDACGRYGDWDTAARP